MSARSELRARIAERADLAGMLDYYAPSPALAAALGLRTLRLGSGAAFAASVLPGTAFHRVLGLGLDGPVPEATLDAVLEFYGGADFAVHVSDLAAPALAGQLLARRFVREGGHVLWLRGADTTPARRDTLRIERVRPGATPLAHGIAVQAFGTVLPTREWFAGLLATPAFSAWLAYDRDEPAGIGMLWTGGELAWLGLGGTRPGFRGRGVQTALIAARIAAAREAGARWVTVTTGHDTAEAPNASYRNVARAGFERVGGRSSFARATGVRAAAGGGPAT